MAGVAGLVEAGDVWAVALGVASALRVWVWVLRFRVWGLGFRAWGLGFRV